MSTNSKAEIDRFGIVIIESLREGELQTGTKLYNDVLKPRCTADESMFCEYYRVHSLPDFEYAISQIIQKHQSNEMLALHIEAHGCEEGVVVSSGDLITWKHFLDCCRGSMLFWPKGSTKNGISSIIRLFQFRIKRLYE